MTIFVSYTRADESLVRALRDDLGRMGQQVWLDHEIHGGELWWREIIRTIQAARVFVFALSQASWKSVPCHAEFDYAQQLGLPVLPVQVGPLDNLRIPIMERQLVDYRERSADAIVSLAGALTELTGQKRVLPNPLPPPPKVPFEYLYRIAELLGPQPIAPERQEIIIGQLRRHLRTERDEIARADILKLLREFRERGEITNLNSREIDEILGSVEEGEAEGLPEGVTWLSAADHWRKNPVLIGPPPVPEPEGTQPAGAAEHTSSGTTPTWLRNVVAPEAQSPTDEPKPAGSSTSQWWQGEKPAPSTVEPTAPRQSGPQQPAPQHPASRWPAPQAPAPEPRTPEPPAPQPPAPTPSNDRSWAFVSATLGATGIPFLLQAAVGGSPLAPLVGVVVLIGLALGVVAMRKHEPRARQSVVIASVGLLGVVLCLLA